MLVHSNDRFEAPTRVVVIGAAGFVGGAACRAFGAEGWPVEPIGRAQIDLVAPGASERLARRLRPSDSVVIACAKAPAKTNGDVVENVRMIAAVADAIASVPVAHAVYVSSDAVYADSAVPLTEESRAQPESLHGAMHLARELIIKIACKGSLCILRPTLIYGARDPHNGYGPNRFIRQVMAGQDIVLFGEGEERRDHVAVEDVARILQLVLAWRSAGVLNVATGQVASFREIAHAAVAGWSPKVDVRGSTRVGPMPHGGYRPFDTKAVADAFPGFRFLQLVDGIAKMRDELRQVADKSP
ncbi:MAG: NAD-dependent epimerase/dehydratase family protein [Telmatospirillum sp.]|nr:NAD-dependent epimerase/dehydratase family protein [Telmatospirillum sp.]